MTFELANLEDIPLLIPLLNQLFEQESEFKPNIEAQKSGLEKIISDNNTGFILVARNESTIIGMVNILFTVSTALGSRVGLLEDMVVLLKGRGTGVGTQLLKRALELAKEYGCKRITLLTDHDNSGAHSFYERSGFTQSSMVVFRINNL